MQRATIAATALFGLTIAGASWAHAQQQPPVLQPTTVQLPTFRVFTVQTTVSVPDSGGALLGGVQRARDGSLVRGGGPLKSRSLASDRDAGTTSVHATVVDPRAIDEALRTAAARRSGTPIDPAAAKASQLSRHVADAPPGSLAAIRAEKAAADAKKTAAISREAAELFAQGQRAEAAGNYGAAKVFYQMAARRSQGAVKQRALERLNAMSKGMAVAAKR